MLSSSVGRGFRLVMLMVLLVIGGVLQALPAEIVVMRHGDKNDDEDWNHNLNTAGLKRSLALPQVLLGRFGTPGAIFAPQPKAPNGGNIRSIQLITPTAVAAKVNIDTQFGVGDEQKLAEAILSDRTLDGKTIFIVWEHQAIAELVADLGAPEPKKWKGNDFDSLWILKFQNGKVLFTQNSEGLNN